MLALPCAVLLLSIAVWVTAVSRSAFWADDFLNVTHFAQSLGSLSNDHINDGHYIINVFWGLGTLAFGAGSALPFLMLNTLVFASGLVVWLRLGIKTRWSALEAWWIAGLFIATAAWLPTTLWSSNITHSGGFLALGAGLLAHERCMGTQTRRTSVLWSLASGAAWTLAVVSNIVYIGLLPIAGYCAFHQVVKIRRLEVNMTRVSLAVVVWNLVLPVFYFAAVAYPATTASTVYATNGLRFVHQNLHFYRHSLAPTSVLLMAYVTMSTLGIVGGLAAIRRRDWFPITLLVAAGATAAPALIQSQQRDIHYLAMPLLLLFSALAAGAKRPEPLGQSKRLVRLRDALLLLAIVTLLLVFKQGAGVRSYFVTTPFGHSLARFRSQVASLTPEGGTICVRESLTTAQESLLVAEMSGVNGFLVPPISAAVVYLVPAGKRCPAQGPTAQITVSLDARGDFVAAA